VKGLEKCTFFTITHELVKKFLTSLEYVPLPLPDLLSGRPPRWRPEKSDSRLSAISNFFIVLGLCGKVLVARGLQGWLL